MSEARARALSGEGPSGLEYAAAAVGNVAEGLGNVLAAVPESAAIIQGIFQKPTSSASRAAALSGEKPLPVMDNIPAQRFADEVKGLAEGLVEENPEAENFWTRDVTQGFGSTGGFMLGGALGAVAKVPALASIAGLGASAGFSSGYWDARANGADQTTALTSALLNAGAGTSEAAPIAGVIAGMFRRMPMGERLLHMLVSGIEEGAQETFQQTFANGVAQYLYDDEREVLEGAVRSGGAGLISGLLFGGLAGSMGAPSRSTAVDGARGAEGSGALPGEGRQSEAPGAVRTEKAAPEAAAPPVSRAARTELAPEESMALEEAKAFVAQAGGDVSKVQAVESTTADDQWIDEFASNRGRRVVHITGAKEAGIQGVALHGEGVFVVDADLDPVQKRRRVVFHEMAGHLLRGGGQEGSQAWRELNDDLMGMDPDGMQAVRGKVREVYGDLEEGGVGGMADESVAVYAEQIGAYLSEAFDNPQRLLGLAEKNPGLVRRIIDAARDILAKIPKLGISSSARKRLEALQREIAQTTLEQTGDPEVLAQTALRIAEALNSTRGMVWESAGVPRGTQAAASRRFRKGELREPVKEAAGGGKKAALDEFLSRSKEENIRAGWRPTAEPEGDTFVPGWRNRQTGVFLTAQEIGEARELSEALPTFTQFITSEGGQKLPSGDVEFGGVRMTAEELREAKENPPTPEALETMIRELEEEFGGPTAAPSRTLEPHEMTEAAFNQRTRRGEFREARGGGRRERPLTHQQLVRRAVLAGEYVPQRVLAEYPGIQTLAKSKKAASSRELKMAEQGAAMGPEALRARVAFIRDRVAAGDSYGEAQTALEEAMRGHWAPGTEDMNEAAAEGARQIAENDPEDRSIEALDELVSRAQVTTEQAKRALEEGRGTPSRDLGRYTRQSSGGRGPRRYRPKHPGTKGLDASPLLRSVAGDLLARLDEATRTRGAARAGLRKKVRTVEALLEDVRGLVGSEEEAAAVLSTTAVAGLPSVPDATPAGLELARGMDSATLRQVREKGAAIERNLRDVLEALPPGAAPSRGLDDIFDKYREERPDPSAQTRARNAAEKAREALVERLMGTPWTMDRSMAENVLGGGDFVVQKPGTGIGTDVDYEQDEVAGIEAVRAIGRFHKVPADEVDAVVRQWDEWRRLVDSAIDAAPSRYLDDLIDRFSGDPENRPRSLDAVIARHQAPGRDEALGALDRASARVRIALDDFAVWAREFLDSTDRANLFLSRNTAISRAVDNDARTPPDVVDALREYWNAQDSLDTSAPSRALPEGSFASYYIPPEKKREAFRRYFQKELLRLQRTQQELEKQGVTIDDSVNASQAATLFEGRVKDRLEGADHEVLQPIGKLRAEHDISLEAVGQFLHARHAEKRNQVIMERGKGFGHEENPGSGMRTSRAKEILAEIEAGPKAEAYAEIGRLFDQLNDRRLEIAVESGLMSQEEADGWKETFGPHYAPLRDEVDPAGKQRGLGGGFGSGAGFGVRRGPISKRAKGRGAGNIPDNPLIFAWHQFSDTAIQAEKNVVGNRLKALVERAPDPKLWTVTKLGKGKLVMTNEGELVFRSDLELDPDANERDFFRIDTRRHMATKVDGETHIITFADPLMARAMNRLGRGAHPAIRSLGKVNRLLSSLNTSWDPEFVIGNFLRDIQTAGLNLGAEEGGKMAWEVVKGAIPSAKAAYRVMRNRDAKGELEDYFREAQEVGGRVGWFHQGSFEDAAKSIERELKLVNPKNAAQKLLSVGNKIKTFVEDANSGVENGVRLSAYIEARKRGFSKEQAGVLMKELTVNFNQKGEAGALMNSLYMFYNAGVQGTARTFKVFARAAKPGPAGKFARRVVLSAVSGGFLLDMLARAWAPDDDDGENMYDKLPEWEKERNLIIWIPGTDKYMKIPLPYGYNALFSVGHNAAATAFGPKSVSEATKDIGAAALGAFNPMGSSSEVEQILAPTLFDPLIQSVTNETFYGAPIRPEQPQFEADKPRSQLFWSSINPTSQAITEWLNSATGGDKYEPGVIDLSPEDLEHWVEFATGGVGRTIRRLAGLAPPNEDLEWRDVPFWRRIAGRVDTERITNQDFYEALQDTERAQSRVDDARDSGSAADPSYMKVAGLRKQGAKLRKRVSALKKQIKSAKGDKKKELEKMVKSLQSEFLRKFKEASGQ